MGGVSASGVTQWHQPTGRVTSSSLRGLGVWEGRVGLQQTTRVTTLGLVSDWSLITGRGGLQNGKIAGPKLFAPPPLKTG